MKVAITYLFSVVIFLQSCIGKSDTTKIANFGSPIQPAIVTQKVFDDSDDPAIWIHPTDVERSIILGTDKHTENGGLYVFTLDGKIDRTRSKTGMKRVNNVDVITGFLWGDTLIDIAAATERDRNCIRIFRLPDMTPIDGNGIEVFEGEKERSPMGIALYKRNTDNAVFVIVSRKHGPLKGYLAQYLLEYNGNNEVKARLVRMFGAFSGKKEIESIAVDHQLGFIYYSDEQFGIRKYYADPDKGNEELALFGKAGFKNDNEGISIYVLNDTSGYILVSDQSANAFQVYSRTGTNSNPHAHHFITSVLVSAKESDGSEVTNMSLPGFPGGMFVAMSTDGSFHIYRWKDIANAGQLQTKQ
ncbi:MAG: phytase [Chitinophagaceae bacterium]